MIDSKDYIKRVQHGCVDAGMKETRLCEQAGVSYSTWASMKDRVNKGGEITLTVINPLIARLSELGVWK